MSRHFLTIAAALGLLTSTACETVSRSNVARDSTSTDIPLPSAPLKWTKGDAPVNAAAVLIAADTYLAEPSWALPSAVDSATAIRTMLLEQAGLPASAVETLRGRDVSADYIEAAIQRAGTLLRGTPGSVLWVYYCGHGWVRDGEQQLFTHLTRDEGGGYAKAIDRSDLLRWMTASLGVAGEGSQGLLVVDACRRNTGDPPPRARLLRSDVWEVYGVSEGRMVAAGSGGRPFAFTEAWVDTARALASAGGDADLRRVFGEAQRRTTEIAPGQTPELREPTRSLPPPAVVVTPRVRFRLRVVDALTGVTVPGAEVTLADRTESAPDGTCSFAVSPAEHVVQVRAEGYLARTERLTIDRAQHAQDLSFPLQPALTVIRGRVDPPGVVLVRAQCEGARPDYHQTEAYSDGTGAFELRVPRLAGTRASVLQEGKEVATVVLPSVPDRLVTDRTGTQEGIGVVFVRVPLSEAVTPQPAAAPDLSREADRFDWERVQQMVQLGRYDLARVDAAKLKGGPEFARYRVWLDSRWAERDLVEGLREGKDRGEWARADAVLSWWKAGPPAVDNAERVRELMAEHARERMPLEARRSYEAGNRALADGRFEEALAAYEAARPGLTEHYRKIVLPHVERIHARLYDRFLGAGRVAEFEKRWEKALAAYADAAEHDARAGADIRNLLRARPELAETDRGRALALRVATRLETGIGLTMIRVEAGEFWMGSPESEAGRDSDEQRHRVKITKAYWLGETEVTQAQWRAVMGTEPWKGKQHVREGDTVAVTYVSHTEAREFCRKLTEREKAAGRLPEGYRYVLPTEAEWERAARAGSETAYSFGSDEGRLREHAVYADARDGQFAQAVKSRKANTWGFHDLHGNVWEWCADFANWDGKVVTDTYRDGVVDPLCRSGSQRVIRGGSWYDPAAYCRSAVRFCLEPGSAGNNLGVRPALAARSDVE